MSLPENPSVIPSPQRLVRRFIKDADLSPPLGYPGGPCDVMQRIRQEAPSRAQDALIELVEKGKDLNNQQSALIYDDESDRGWRGSTFKQMVIKPHAQYRMDLRGVSVSDLRLFFRAFQKEWAKRKSQGRLEWQRSVLAHR